MAAGGERNRDDDRDRDRGDDRDDDRDRGGDRDRGDDRDGGGADDPGAGGDESGTDDLPGVPATPRTRAKSAALWGVVGGIAFLVAAQGYLLLDGDLPVGYAGLFALAGVLAVSVAGVAYRIEHRIGAKRRT